MSKIVIIGDIQPPLSNEELEVLAEDPKFCIEGNIALDKISIALEEGKVKRLWGELNKEEVEEGEEKPTKEEMEAMEELENSLRRTYDFDEKSLEEEE